MRKYFVVILSFFIILSCTKKTYLEIAESEINAQIEEHLNCKNDYYYEELKNYFENYLINCGLTKQNEKIEIGYYNYLKYIVVNGSGLNKIENSEVYLELKYNIHCSGLHKTNNEINRFLVENFEPTIKKYKSDLLNEKRDDELIYRIGTSNPNNEMNITLVLNGLLRQYKLKDFKRPILKKFVILFCFVQLEMI